MPQHDPLSTIRQEARRRGIPWDRVQWAYHELKQTERHRRERPNAVREAAWMMHTASSPGSWPFWRHGFLARFGRRLANGADHTIIRGYDEITQQVGWEFPEYIGPDAEERLWDLLLSPYDRLPDRETLYRRALDMAQAMPQAATIDPGIDPGIDPELDF